MAIYGWVRRNVLFEQFLDKNDDFTKTGSGQTYEKLTQKVRFI